jgi:chaperonin GroEL
MNYNPKKLVFDLEAQSKLISGIEKLSRAVKSTLGPRGNTVLIESPNHTKGMTITKDGATVAKSVELLDPIENLACRMMREASEMTAMTAGDGTTTSVILAEQIVTKGFEVITKNPELNKTEILRAIIRQSDNIIEKLKAKAIPITPALLRSIATISANNDEFVGDLISRAYEQVGNDGVVHFEKSKTDETYIDLIDGIKIDTGYANPAFITDHSNDTTVFEQVKEEPCYVVVCGQDITNYVNQLNMEFLAELTKKQVLFIAPFSNNSLQSLALNVQKQGFKWAVVPPPSTGYRQKELLADIALSVGATYFSEETGNDISLMSHKDLGRVSKITISKDRTVIIPNKEYLNNEAIEERKSQIKAALSNTPKEFNKKLLSERLSILSGKLSIVYAGGFDMEQKELYDRIEDSVLAVRSAIEEGVLAGAGRSIYNAVHEVYVDIKANPEEQEAHFILRQACETPLRQILINSGLEKNENLVFSTDENYWINSKTGEYGDLIEMGIIDPLKVTRVALSNAVKVATTILSTNAVITMAREIE